METPFLDRLIEKIRDILKGIDKDVCQDKDGWWETSTGAEFGVKKLKEIEYLVKNCSIPEEVAEYEAIKKALAKPRFIETLLSEENAKKMALEYTGAEEEYQGFILACGVIAEKISKQNL